MASVKSLDKTYMKMALAMSELSYGERLKVGAVAVTKNDVVLTGVNGLPNKLGNNLEVFDGDVLVTKDTVIHAENALLCKAAKEGVSMIGSTVYITHSCCSHCASMLVSVGVSRVVYLDEYRSKKGIDILRDCDIVVEKFNGGL